VPYREMVARVLSVLEPSPRLIELPTPVFGIVLLCARKLSDVGGFNATAVARMRSDLVFDATPARNDFGYAPRAFRPTAPMFMPR
jgi:hypothetical protein